MSRKALLLGCAISAAAPFQLFAEEAAKPAAAPAAPEGLTTESQQFSYAIGLEIARSLAPFKTELDQTALNRAISDSLAGKKPAMDPAQLTTARNTVIQRVQAAEKAKRDAAGAAAKASSAAFLAENAKKDGVKVTESGLQYKATTEGEGDAPTASDRVKVHYRGTLLDGTEFDSSYSRNAPAFFGLSQVIKGWTEGLQLMKPGAKYRFWIPSELAYGATGSGNRIPPHSTLIFDVELLAVNPK